MPVEGNQNLPSPLLSDPPDGPSQIAAANAAIAGRLNMRFASTSARDAELTNPSDGMECFIGSGISSAKQVFWNGQWRAMQSFGPVQALLSPQGSHTFPDSTYDWFGPMSANSGDKWGDGILAYNTDNGTTEGTGLVAGVSGLYQLQAGFRSDGSTKVGIQLRLNGNVVTKRLNTFDPSGSSWGNTDISITLILGAGDKLGVQAWASGGSRNRVNNETYINMVFFGSA